MCRWTPLRSVMLATTALVPLGMAAATANPLGPNIVGGGASVSGVGTSSVTINQTTPRAIVNWNSFNIGGGETTRFVQPDAGSVALNRVTGGLGASLLYGTLTANGRVFLVNPDGVLIGGGATINTAGFLATTNDISNANFMAGRYQFNIPGRPDASIVNEGTINAHSHGFAALVAPGVRNSGTITASYGKIGLAAGNSFSLDFYGDKLITLAVNDSIATTVRDVATGKPLKDLVKNDGKLSANGGRVELTAAAARTVVDSVINNTGVIEARSVGTYNGKIVLGGPTAATKVAGLPPQTVKVSGSLSTAHTGGGKGGTIQVTGERIVITAASFDASGATGGGTVLIGGDTGGGHGDAALASIPQAKIEAGPIPNATSVSIDAATTIDASATSVGDGGKVIVWADGSTVFAGTITAKGGSVSGNGGFAEVSGKQTLSYTGFADLRALRGSMGTLLLDPGNLTISASGVDTTTPGPGSFTGSELVDTTLLVATLLTALDGGNVIVKTGVLATGGDGDIIVADSFSWGTGASSASSLTFSAYRDVIFNNGVTVTNAGTGHFNLRADSTGIGNGTVVFNGTGGPQINSTGGGSVLAYYNPAIFGTPDFNTSRVSVTGGGSLTTYMLVNNLNNLQNLVDPFNYALGNSNISGGTFNPITFSYNGIFDGLNHTISNVNVIGPALIGFNSGTFRNLTLVNFTVNATANNQFVGLLVGNNTDTGQIINVHTSGTVNGGAFTGIIAGGVVGQNNGTIAGGSSSSANVTIGDGLSGSGGGWNYAGGLAGSNAGTISSSVASGNVVVGSNAFAGGLVGQNGNFGQPGTAAITLSSATGNVSSAGVNVSLGGLVGFNAALLSQVFAEGNVTSTGSVVNNGINCSATFSCQNISAGGLVGQHSGTVSTAYATGAVHVGSGGTGGGLIGQSDGIVVDTFATGAVTGAAGPGSNGNFDNDTTLGGLIGSNHGLVGLSHATGNVGSPGVDRLQAGGLVGNNSGYIALTYATGNVRAGNFSQAGGLVGSGDSNCFSCSIGDGAAYSNLNTILSSTASGTVSVGSVSLAGGFAGSGSFISNSSSSGAVTGGGNSILGGFAGVHDVDGLIYLSTATGSVTSTGPSAWLGGFVGLNAGVIHESAAYGPVTGVSSSILGGFAGVNLGGIENSSSFGSVTGTGGDNVAGGFGGANFGLIANSTSTGNVTSGPNSVVGRFLGANAAFINIPPGLVDYSTFPIGTLVNSTGSGTATGGSGGTVGDQVGVSYPSKLPTYPSIIDGCHDGELCGVFRIGVLGIPGGAGDVTVPNQVLAPPNLQILPGQLNEPQPLNALIKLTSLDTPTPGGTTQQSSTTTSAPPGTPPRSLAPARPLRTVPGPDGEIRSNVPLPGVTQFLSTEIVVQALLNTPPATIQQFAQQLGLTIITSQTMPGIGRQVFRFRLGSGQTVRNIIRALEANSAIVAQPNYTYQLVQAPAAIAPFTASRGDPAQYSMGKLHLDEAHRVSSGKGITVAVIDSEVDNDHAELAGTISQRFDATESDARAHSHGTAMAGAIVSRDRLLGVAPGARILAVRAFSETQSSAESTTVTILKSIEWAVSQGARVINMSFAGPYDPSLERVLKDAAAKGVIMIAASGNAGPKSPPLWPGADPNVIAVTATDSGDRLFRQANRGPYVSVASPGVEILSAAPQSGYQMSTGTSIATAHVSGVVALMLEQDPTLTPLDVRLILESTASDLGPKGRDTQFGWGLVSPSRALAMVDERKRQRGTASTPPSQR